MLNAKCFSSQRFLKVMVANKNINNWYSKNARLETRVGCCRGQWKGLELRMTGMQWSLERL